MTANRCILDSERIGRVLTRITHEILERNKDSTKLVLVAIRRGGEIMGRRIAEKLHEIEKADFPLGFLDITLYRDDLSLVADYPIVRRTELPFSLEGKDVILIDDVLFTGRTVRAALEGLPEFGRPDTIQLVVLIDRHDHRDLPIHADYVGRAITTTRDQRVEVTFTGDGSGDCVEIQEQPSHEKEA